MKRSYMEQLRSVRSVRQRELAALSSGLEEPMRITKLCRQAGVLSAADVARCSERGGIAQLRKRQAAGDGSVYFIRRPACECTLYGNYEGGYDYSYPPR